MILESEDQHKNNYEFISPSLQKYGKKSKVIIQIKYVTVRREYYSLSGRDEGYKFRRFEQQITKDD